MACIFYGHRYSGVKGPYKDRHGKVRIYYRPTGVALPDPAAVKFRVFDRAYKEAVAGRMPVREKPAHKPISGPQTIEKAVREYTASESFAKLAEATQYSRKSLLEIWCKRDSGNVGAAQLASLTAEDIKKALKKRTPTSAKNWFYAVRALVRWAMDEKKYGIKTDPTIGIELPESEPTEGWKAWTEADAAAYIRAWPKGTGQYLALQILLSSGQRRSDVIKFGWHRVEDGGIRFTQKKTGKKMLLPIAPSLAEVLPPRPENVVELRPVPFLTTTPGKYKHTTPVPFTPSHFTRWFRDACDAAGLPDLSAHGVRKLAARTIYRNVLRAGRTVGDAEAITMAFTGHKSAKMLRVYLGEDFEQEEYAGELAAFMR